MPVPVRRNPVPSVRLWWRRRVQEGAGLFAAAVLVLNLALLPAAEPEMLTMTRPVNPASCSQIAACNGVYYLFSHSGNASSSVTLTSPRAGAHAANIYVRTSTDLKTWSNSQTVFGTGTGQAPKPAWWTADPDLHPYWYVWAPSVDYFNGRFHLYYALAPDWQDTTPRPGVPTRRDTVSAIGLVTTTTLDPTAKDAAGKPQFQWRDQGLVVAGKGAIDPSVVWNGSAPYLLYGSGVPLCERPLSVTIGTLADPTTVKQVAHRSGVQEAPVILHHGDWYYLFFAYGDYRAAGYGEYVGRARSYAGPFLDRGGKDLMNAGGTTFITATTINGIYYYAPAHGSVFTEGDTVYWVGQYYQDSAQTGGRHLWISTMVFDQDGWPACALTPPYTYALTVMGGSGGGTYAAKATVTISADAAPAGQVFDRWLVSGGAATLTSATAASTTLTMPAIDQATAVTVSARFKAASAAAPVLLPVQGSITPASCPQICKQNGVYYVFTHSGNGGTVSVGAGSGNIYIRSSTDLITWTDVGRVFAATPTPTMCTRPAWWTASATQTYSNLWKPTVQFFDGRYHLYYSLGSSNWGTMACTIAQVTNLTLDPQDAQYQWVDGGRVVDAHNGIDPNLTWDASTPANLLLTSGCFVPHYLRPVDLATGLLTMPQPHPLVAVGTTGTEAVQIFRKNGWWFFTGAVSHYDKANYRNIIGRSRAIQGPYLDRAGKDLAVGGGTNFTQGPQTIAGITYHCPGHGSFFTDSDGKDYWVSNYYPRVDATTGLGTGGRILFISTIVWDEEGWPLNRLTPAYAYVLTVAHGTGGGTFTAGTTRTLVADPPPAGQVFAGWQVVAGGATLASATAATTTLTMARGPATVMATYQSVGVVPAITTQPTSQTCILGQSATFTVAASGTPPPTCQWQENGVGIAGATAASYTTPATVAVDNGAVFRCVVSNSLGTITSNAATLTLTVVPTITTQPDAQTRAVGQTATFIVAATGLPAPTYQWQENGVDIAGATAASFTTPILTALDNGLSFRCVARNSSGSVTSNAATLAIAWNSRDVGTVAAAGDSSLTNGTWTVHGSGRDIWNTADGFHFVWQQVVGDVCITARVASLTDTNAWAKAGVMVRESLAAGSRHAVALVSSRMGTAFQRRLATDGPSSHTAGPLQAAPCWVRLERIGGTLIGSCSPDGVVWTEIRRDIVVMGASASVGLAVTSHADGTVATATFTNVQITAAGNAAN